MSDPAKSADEIEDVLASIRRLVSESGASMPPARPAPAVAPVPDQPAEPAAEKLLLTPADRVTDPDDPWAPVTLKTPGAAVADMADSDDGDDADDDGPAWGPDDRLADWGEVEDSGDEAVADALAEEQAATTLPTASVGEEMHHQPTPDLGPDPGSDPEPDLEEDAAAPRLAEFEPETGDADWPDQGATSALRDLAAARAHVSAPEMTEGTAYPVDDMEAEADDRDMRDLSARHDAADSPMTQDSPADHDDGNGAARRAVPIFSRRSEGPRPAQAAWDEEGREEGPSEEAASQEAVHGAEDDGAAEIEDLGEDPSPFTFPDSEEGILDEETLRDLIAEVVREELQGAMGQRITRNVRKMVRREIRIALAAEDLE